MPTHLSTYRGSEWPKYSTRELCIHGPRNIRRHRLGPVRVVLLGLGSKYPTESPDHDFTVTYNFCEELADGFPGAESIRRKKGQRLEMGRIAGWAASRGYQEMLVVNEDVKKPIE